MFQSMIDKKFRINDRKKLNYFLECDRAVLGIPASLKKPRLLRDYIWKFEILMRKTEYLSNKKSLFIKPIFLLYLLRYKRWCRIYNLEIPLNCIREGLRIWHLNGIIINPNAKIGRNCSISARVVIGQSKDYFPTIGDNVELMVESKVLGANVSDNICVGASSLVIRSITANNKTVAGIPARVISNNYPEYMLKNKVLIDNISKIRRL